MKTPRFLSICLLLVVATQLTSSGFGQGSLTPPSGAPTPTMKTLDQVEARTIVNATNTPGNAASTFIINAPGSYYLTGNITGVSGKNGITILASNVTLDLNGFALISGGGAGARGVNTTTAISNFSLRNGSLSGWAGGGVRAEFAVTFAEKLLLADNVGGPGLAVGNGSLVKDCVASGNATGFYCPDRTQISNCVSTVNTGAGFDCTSYVNLLDCTSSRNGGNGIVVLGGCSVIRCSATRNLPAGSGIVAGDSCTIVNCTAGNNGTNGISARTGCTITDCTAGYNGGRGISTGIQVMAGDGKTPMSGNSIRNCTVRGNGDIGIYDDGKFCQIVGNTCELNASGIIARGGRIEGNSCTTNTEFGIYSSSGQVVGNTCDENAKGIDAGEGRVDGNLCDRNTVYGFSTPRCLLIRNSARFNHVNFDFDSVPIGTVIQRINQGQALSTSPWANFEEF